MTLVDALGHRAPTPQPTAAEVECAIATYAVHIPSLTTRICHAPECGGPWPCPEYHRAVAVLDRAGLIDVDGHLRVQRYWSVSTGMTPTTRSRVRST